MNAPPNTVSIDFGSSFKHFTNAGHTLRSFVTRLAILCLVTSLNASLASSAALENQEEDYYPAWAAHTRYLQPLAVLDTDSALGRRNRHSKSITLKDMARMHGHLCDGLVTAWVELSAALRELFPDGVVDRTDVRVVSKNGPCWADAGAWMTGARINQGTLIHRMVCLLFSWRQNAPIQVAKSNCQISAGISWQQNSELARSKLLGIVRTQLAHKNIHKEVRPAGLRREQGHSGQQQQGGNDPATSHGSFLSASNDKSSCQPRSAKM